MNQHAGREADGGGAELALLPLSVKPVRRVGRGRDFLMDEPVHLARRGGAPFLVVPVRLTSYRSLPLSCIEAVSLSLDGDPVRTEDVRLRLNGDSYELSSLGSLPSVWWWILDPAELLIALDGELAPGEHRIDAELVTVEPYVTNGRFHFYYPSSRTFSLDGGHVYQEVGVWS